MRSLRRRALWGAASVAAVSVTVAFFAVYTYFDTLLQRRFNEALAARQRQVVIALGNSLGDAETLELYLTDPEYARPLSGRYWQLVAPDGSILASRSLFDAALPLPPTASEEPAFWTGSGPEGPLRGVQQVVQLERGGAWTVAVAESMDALATERRGTLGSLLTAFAVVGLFGVAGGLVQVGLALRPLARLREDVAHRWDAGEALDPSTYPEEVAPLVSDINLLLERNRTVIDSARRQAADLAHALKTPVAILHNELERRGRRKADFAEARDALARIDAQLLRSLARIRAGNSAAVGHRTELQPSVERLARLFRRMPHARDLELTVDVPAELTVGMDRQDIEELLGNLMENALKWRRGRVRVEAAAVDGTVVIHVDDDGPGVPVERRAEALRPGGRLDTSAPGTGLGLAIATDLVTAYGGTIALDTAPELGGLRVTISLPTRLGPMERRETEGT